MNVNIYHEGVEITNKVISYDWSKEICSAQGIVNIILPISHGLSLVQYDSLVIYEEGVKKGTFTINSFTNDVPDAVTSIVALDDSRKLEEFFVSENYFIDYPSTNVYWIEKFLTDAKIDYVIESDVISNLLNNDTTLGMDTVGSIILPLLQMSGLFLYFDADNVAHIGKLAIDTTSVHATVTDSEILNATTTEHDKMFRNRVVVWGKSNPITSSWVYVDLDEHGKYRNEYGPNDVRTVGIQNSHIRTNADAKSIGIKLLKEVEKINYEVSVELEGAYDLKIGDRLRIDSQYLQFTGTITTIGVNMSSNGLVTHITLNQRCPRLFGFFDYGGEVFVGTEGSGVLKKHLKYNHTWNDFSTGITNLNIFDLAIANTNFAAVSYDGRGYVRNYADASWHPVSYAGFTNTSGEVSSYSTEILASGVIASGVINPSGVYASSCAVGRIDSKIYVAYNSYVPDYYNGKTFYSSGWTYPSGTMADGFENRCFIAETSTNGVVTDSYQVSAVLSGTEGVIYDLTNINLQADNEGVTGVYQAGSPGIFISDAIDGNTYTKGEKFEWFTSNKLDTYTRSERVRLKTFNSDSFASYTLNRKTYAAFSDYNANANILRVYDWTVDPFTKVDVVIPDNGASTYSSGVVHAIYVDTANGYYFDESVLNPAREVIIILIYMYDGTSLYYPEFIFYDPIANAWGTINAVSGTPAGVGTVSRPGYVHGHTATYRTFVAYLHSPQDFILDDSSVLSYTQCFNRRLRGISILHEKTTTQYKVTVKCKTRASGYVPGIAEGIQTVTSVLFEKGSLTTAEWNSATFSVRGTAPSYSRSTERTYFYLDVLCNKYPDITSRVRVRISEFGDLTQETDPENPLAYAVFGSSSSAPIFNNNQNTNKGIANDGYYLGYGTAYILTDAETYTNESSPVFYRNTTGSVELPFVGYLDGLDYLDDSFYWLYHSYPSPYYNVILGRFPNATYSSEYKEMNLGWNLGSKPAIFVPSFQENIMMVRVGILGYAAIGFFEFGSDVPEPPPTSYLLINTKNKISTVIDQYSIPYKVENDYDTYNIVWNPWNSWIFPQYAYYPIESGWGTILLPALSGTARDMRYASLYEEALSGTTALAAVASGVEAHVLTTSLSGPFTGYVAFSGEVTHLETTNMQEIPYMFTTTSGDRTRFYQRDSEETLGTVPSGLGFIERTNNLPDVKINVIRCDDEV